MGLYIAYTSDVRKRQANTVFFFHHNKCLSLEDNIVSKPHFEVKTNDIQAYQQIVSIAEKHSLDSYEIVINEESLLEKLLDFLTNYLLDKDLSIGLITEDDQLIKNNKELIDSYGVNSPLTRSDIYDTLILERPEPRMAAKGPSLENVRARKEPSVQEDLGPIVLRKASIKRKPILSKIELEESFHDKFMKFLIESGKDNVEVYKAAGISKQVFSKILSDKNMIPTKLTVVSLCIGLRLTLKESKDLMVAAGYSLSRSLIFDSIVMKYLKEEIYNFDLINSELNEYGCPILGWHPREK